MGKIDADQMETMARYGAGFSAIRSDGQRGAVYRPNLAFADFGVDLSHVSINHLSKNVIYSP